MRFILFFFTIFFGLLTRASAQGIYDSNQTLAVESLAVVSVGHELRRYSVRVRNCGRDITHLKLRITNAALFVDGAGVTFTDGGSEQFYFSYVFPKNYDSPWFGVSDLKPQDKCVKSIFVHARSDDPDTLSRVEVLALTED